MRRQLSGTFLTQALGEGAWRLSRRGADPMDIFLRGADSAAADKLRQPEVQGVCIEWRADSVQLVLVAGRNSVLAGAQSAIVHEPQPCLYEVLPLVRLDDKARRFWRRVFLLVRIPGGRRLLGFLARRSRVRD